MGLLLRLLADLDPIALNKLSVFEMSWSHEICVVLGLKCQNVFQYTIGVHTDGFWAGFHKLF